MHPDPLLLKLLIAVLALLGVGLLMRFLRQPHIVAYLLAGVLLGPHGIGLLDDAESMARAGEFGVALLLFFVGMKVSPRKLMARWRVTGIGTLMQILASVGVVALVGIMLDWEINRIVLIGFVISLSSTAVVLNVLQDRNELHTQAGRDVIGVLLTQDLAIIPMLIIIGLLGGEKPSTESLVMQGIGVFLILFMLWWLTTSNRVRLPMGARLRNDHEMQVFAALGLLLGMAYLSAWFGLSAAMGAFLAGMLIGVAKETNWVQNRLDPFRVVFVALFFVSIGALVDLGFFAEHFALIVSMAGLVLVTNWLINAFTFRLLGESWGHSVYAGALLSQIGEFSFILAAVGLQVGTITNFAYQLTVAIIAVSLLFAPAWINLASFINPSARNSRGKPSWIC
ncbi:MAG: cation:proton antiporter [Oceanococcus sp.]